MNERVRIHFDEIEARLIECPAILSYRIIRRDISPDDGKLRIRSTLRPALCSASSSYRFRSCRRFFWKPGYLRIH
jgi:hypothetical protein